MIQVIRKCGQSVTGTENVEDNALCGTKTAVRMITTPLRCPDQGLVGRALEMTQAILNKLFSGSVRPEELLKRIRYAATYEHLCKPSEPELAAHLATTPDTLAAWKRRPEWHKAVTAVSMKMLSRVPTYGRRSKTWRRTIRRRRDEKWWRQWLTWHSQRTHLQRGHCNLLIIGDPDTRTCRVALDGSSRVGVVSWRCERVQLIGN